ncbi:MAG: hypothetical protein IPJ77_08055 [Planctomycetes bacterium]|nr:hypothetical protein [Planctomycetota bacterium]
MFQLVDRSLATWRNGETRRSLLEMSSSVQEELAADLAGLEPGARGDLVLEWVAFDTDGNGTLETKWPRLRLVRQAGAADVERIVARDAPPRAEKDDGSLVVAPASPGLVEVLWMVAPASFKDRNARSEGLLWRGERLVGDARTKSLFANDFFGASNRPPAGATEPVTGGLLWMEILCASHTSIVHDGWERTAGLDSVAASWDAWGKGRPDPDVHVWNEPLLGLAKPRERAVLPRRVRIELELERPIDRVRRTVTLDPMETGDGSFRVDDARHLPFGEDRYVLIDAEWMKVMSIDGDTVGVQRAQRGTTAVLHEARAMVHFGERLVREVPVATCREEWDLR